MQLRNRFNKEEVNRWWWDHNFCGECRSNQGVALHHIDGCKKEYHASLFNSIPLCLKCHSYYDGFNGGSKRTEYIRQKLTKYTMKYLVEQQKPFDLIDQDYISSIQERVNFILLEN